MGATSFASPTVRLLVRQRVGQLVGVAIVLLAAALIVALVSYNPRDPSMNTATSRLPTNLLGPSGAMVADVLVQYFGAVGGLPVLALLAWGYRVAAARPLRLGMRVLFLVLGMPMVAAALAGLPGSAGAVTWPGGAGLGGAVGLELGGWMGTFARGLIGPPGEWVALGGEAVLAVLLTLLALGLTMRDYRAAGTGAVGAARGSVRGGIGAAGAVGRSGSRLGNGFRWLTGPIRRFFGPGDSEWPVVAEEAALRRDRADQSPEWAPERAAERLGPLRRETLAEVVARERAAVAPPESFEDGPMPAMPAMPPRPDGAPGQDRAAALRVKPLVMAKKGAPPHQTSLLLTENGWQFPPLSLLSPPPRRDETGLSEDALQANARLLESVLSDYGVQGSIKEIRPGPVVTLYELEPAPGIRSARVIGLADDVARSLSVTAVRIATVSGRNVIGIEVPNAKRETVFLSELLGSGDWASHPGKLNLAIGKDIGGTPVIADLARMPHLLIAGTTGSGKSVGINAMILSILYRMSPEQCRLIMIDPKMLELSIYEGIPHLLAPVVTEPAKAVTALKWTTREMERRYRAMSQLGVRNVGGYNDRVTEALSRGEVVTRRVQTGFDSETGKPIFEEQPLALKPLPYIVVVIDEMADLMMVAGKEVEAAVQRLAQMARAAGIHVIMATQRPSVDVITGTIKANFPTRISYQVISKFDSRTILGEQGAEQLLGQGDLLHMVGGGRIGRVHGPFVADREVEDIVAFLRAQAEPTYDDEVTEGMEEDPDGSAGSGGGIAAAGDGEKALFDQAVDLVTREGKASTSFIQRHLAIGYNRAAKLIEQMEKEGIVTAGNHVGKREVLTRRPREGDP